VPQLRRGGGRRPLAVLQRRAKPRRVRRGMHKCPGKRLLLSVCWLCSTPWLAIVCSPLDQARMQPCMHAAHVHLHAPLTPQNPDDGPSSTQTYILRSVLPLEMRRQLVDNRADDQVRGRRPPAGRRAQGAILSWGSGFQRGTLVASICSAAAGADAARGARLRTAGASA
jgi:hypothetical protein